MLFFIAIDFPFFLWASNLFKVYNKDTRTIAIDIALVSLLVTFELLFTRRFGSTITNFVVRILQVQYFLTLIGIAFTQSIERTLATFLMVLRQLEC